MAARPRAVGIVFGDVFAVGVRVSGNDVKCAPQRCEAFALRLGCWNGTVLRSVGRATSRRHVGRLSVDTIAADVAGVERAFECFTDAWRTARTDTILSGTVGIDDAIRSLVSQGLVTIPGGDDGIAAVVQAWNEEPGYSRADVVNAITRAAHNPGPWWGDLGTQAALERQGSALLYQSVTL